MSAAVRKAFADQAVWCRTLGSPFTARVCHLLGERLKPDDPVSATILGWTGDPTAKADSLPLRVTGALHHLARKGLSPALAAVYPPAQAGDDKLWAAIAAVLVEHEPLLRSYLASVPQTNEVMRSAALLPGLLTIAAATRQPLRLFELGSSAGLNLILDRYRYQFGEAAWGSPDSPLLIKPQWHGAAPPVDAPLTIASRMGMDLNPIQLRDPAARERLLSYVWVDQVERTERLEAAMQLWLADPPTVEAGDAADLLARSGINEAVQGQMRVLMHSIAWSYFPPATQERVTAQMDALGATATAQAPLAWLRYELIPTGADLRLKLWPGGEDRLLALVHPHGAMVMWKDD